MPRVYIAELGKYAQFPDNMSREEIQEQIRKHLGKSQASAGGNPEGVDVMDSLKSGWSAGWSDAKDSGADYLDLFGFDDSADKIRAGLDKDRSRQQFAPEGFVEKLLAGVGAAPGAIAGMAPAVGAGALVTAATANPIAGTAAGFGLHGAVRGGDGDVLSKGALKEGLIGAAEGAAFGGVGKIASRLGRGAASAGIGTGGGAARAAAHGEELDTQDIAAQAATMGLLGAALGGGKKANKGPTIEDAQAGIDRAVAKQARPDVVSKMVEDGTVPGIKPPDFPFNLELLPPKSRDWVIDRWKAGEIKSPERMSRVDMREKATRRRSSRCSKGTHSQQGRACRSRTSRYAGVQVRLIRGTGVENQD